MKAREIVEIPDIESLATVIQPRRNMVKIESDVVVTDENVDDIIAGALESGINYWCDDAKVVGDYLGEYASEQISRGGRLLLHDFEEEETYMLDKEKFFRGLKMYIENPHPYDIIEKIDGELMIDTCNADSTVCDMIIQYALFGNVVYG